MEWSIIFVINSVLLGVGLAMDAFSVSLVNGMNNPKLSIGKMSLIAGVFAAFQFAMPMIGWGCVHTIVERFKTFEKFIPWIALILLCYIGGKMLLEGIHGEEECKEAKLSFGYLMVMGVATSIDALSVGFTIADYGWLMAIACSLIIAVVTYVICMGGIVIGKRFGNSFSNYAPILGGVILIGIGFEIFISSFMK